MSLNSHLELVRSYDKNDAVKPKRTAGLIAEQPVIIF